MINQSINVKEEEILDDANSIKIENLDPPIPVLYEQCLVRRLNSFGEASLAKVGYYPKVLWWETMYFWIGILFIPLILVIYRYATNNVGPLLEISSEEIRIVTYIVYFGVPNFFAITLVIWMRKRFFQTGFFALWIFYVLLTVPSLIINNDVVLFIVGNFLRIIALVLVILLDKPLAKSFKKSFATGRGFGVLVVAILICIVIYFILLAILASIFDDSISSTTFNQTSQNQSAIENALLNGDFFTRFSTIISVLVFAPLFEEYLLRRGGFMTSTKVNGQVVTWFLVTFFFAFMHIMFAADFNQIYRYVGSSIAFGLAGLLYRNFHVGFVTHIIANGIAVLVIYGS